MPLNKETKPKKGFPILSTEKDDFYSYENKCYCCDKQIYKKFSKLEIAIIYKLNSDCYLECKIKTLIAHHLITCQLDSGMPQWLGKGKSEANASWKAYIL